MNRSKLFCRTLLSLFASSLINLSLATTAVAMQSDQDIPMTNVQDQVQAAAAAPAVTAVDPGMGVAAAAVTPGWVGPVIGGISVFGASFLTWAIVITILYGTKDPCDPNNTTWANDTICDNSTECYNLTMEIWDRVIVPLCFNNQLNISTQPR